MEFIAMEKNVQIIPKIIYILIFVEIGDSLIDVPTSMSFKLPLKKSMSFKKS